MTTTNETDKLFNEVCNKLKEDLEKLQDGDDIMKWNDVCGSSMKIMNDHCKKSGIEDKNIYLKQLIHITMNYLNHITA